MPTLRRNIFNSLIFPVLQEMCPRPRRDVPAGSETLGSRDVKQALPSDPPPTRVYLGGCKHKVYTLIYL